MKEFLNDNANKRVVERVFFCDTPFQVFVCLHIQLHNKNDADIFILNSFKNARNVVENIKQCGLFRRAVLVEDDFFVNTKTYNKFTIRIKKIGMYFKVDSIAKKYLGENIIYKNIYCTCNEIFSRLIRLFYVKRKIPADTFLFDEGLGSYDGHFERINILDKIARNIIFGEKASLQDFKLYLFSPELYYDYENRKESIVKIARIDDIDKSYNEVYRDIFECQLFVKKQKCIFFDAIRDDVCFENNAEQEMQYYYELIEQKLGYKNILMKQHPRAKKNYPHKCEAYGMIDYPIELDYLCVDIEKYVLISFSSSAVFTPKIIFDKEPYVLMLNNLNESLFKYSDEVNKTSARIKELYRDKGRVMLPKNKDELMSCLDKLYKVLDD